MNKTTWSREEMAQQAALLIPSHSVINLGIGIPTLIANYIDDETVFIHSENGLLGMGPFPADDEVDPQIINAGKQTVSIVDGGAVFDSALSFAMIRGGHIDIAFLGAMEVDQSGSIANWKIPGKKVTGMGGAMDLVSGAKKIIVLMSHWDKKGSSKLVQECTLPLTGLHCVDSVITELGIFDISDGIFHVRKLALGVKLEEIQQKSDVQFSDDRSKNTL